VNRKRVYGSVCDQLNQAHEQVQFVYIMIWRTCICENNKIVIVIIMCSKLMFLQRLNTLITITLQTCGALVGVHVLPAVVLKD